MSVQKLNQNNFHNAIGVEIHESRAVCDCVMKIILI